MLRLVEHSAAMRVSLPERSIPKSVEDELARADFRVHGEALAGPCSESIVFPALHVSWRLCRTRYPIDVGGRTDFRAMIDDAQTTEAKASFRVDRAGRSLARGAIERADELDTWIPTRRGFSLPAAHSEPRAPTLVDLLVDYPVDPGFVSRLGPRVRATDRRWVDVHLDLSAYAGRRVERVLGTAAGEGSDTNFGSGAFGAQLGVQAGAAKGRAPLLSAARRSGRARALYCGARPQSHPERISCRACGTTTKPPSS